MATVHGQRMCGAKDRAFLRACREEDRCLVTLDAEFGNTPTFPPRKYRGIVLLRIPGRMDPARILAAMETLARALDGQEVRFGGLVRKLWIVEPGRLRVYEGLDDPIPGFDEEEEP